MNRATQAIVGIIIVVAIAIGIGFAVRGNNNKTTTNTAPPPSSSHNINPPSNNSTSSNNQQPTATDKVTIANFAFSPADITVKKGTTVTWTNQDSTEHTVTENDGKNGPSAPPLAQGKSYSFTFNEVGTFHYHCSIHPEMTGSVTVTQ